MQRPNKALVAINRNNISTSNKYVIGEITVAK